MGGDELAALHHLRAAWGADWEAARRWLAELLLAVGRLEAAGAVDGWREHGEQEGRREEAVLERHEPGSV